MIRTRVTIDTSFATLAEAREFTDRLRAGEVGAMWGKTFEVAHVSNIVEPDLPEEK